MMHQLNIRYNYGTWMMVAALLLLLSSCRKFIEGTPKPETEITQALVFEEDATALAAMAGIYNKLAQSSAWSGGSNTSVTYLQGLYADELHSFSNAAATVAPFYLNILVPTNGVVTSTWGSCYNLIYSANRVMEGLSKSTKISPAIRQQLTGEALFIRAFCHFYLVNLFGDVPYIVTTDYRVNTTVSRTPASMVYQGIIADLLEAKNNLRDNYHAGERVRVNKAAATALLARALLYNKEWANAEAQATEVIDKTSQYELLTDLNTVFLKNSREAIWQLIPNGGQSLATEEGTIFILLTTPSNRSALSDSLFEAFEPNDKRKAQWTDTLTVGLSSWYYPYKYKQNGANGTGVEYSMVLRLAEQYLVRAESRAMQNKLTGVNSAAADVNSIRQRAGLVTSTATTQAQLLTAIEQERRVELFTEWGHRFFDLKRWKRLDAVLTGVKPNWNRDDAVYPIPLPEILANRNLTQNAGY